MISQDIRRKFLDYFKKKSHAVISSSSVVPHDDPTLLFINAGMNQFKDVFLGKNIRDYETAVTCQKCIRVGGKHNDLENVGHTSRHLTFFEMLGNFSFGGYFKEKAIEYAWEVSTQVFGFEPEKLWPTVFKNDEEAFELWLKYVPVERITRFGEKDNFWAMGETGPCGPCSEILYDRGSSYGDAKNPSEDTTGERYLEFWNLVFMQFNKDSLGNMHHLPKPSIDTGSGMERVVSLKMGVETVFGIDIFQELIAQIEKVSGKKYQANDTLSPAFHVIADHLRSLAFSIADGAQPSNVDRGYVLRKILRRAVRYGKQLGLEDPFLAKIFPRLIETMGQDYQELNDAKERIEEILTLEEESFFRTLKRGGNILNQVIAQSQAKSHLISGEDAFKLKDTYGLPLDEILLLAKDSQLEVDMTKFEELEKEARERSRSTRKTSSQIANESIFNDYIQKWGPSQFLGFTHYVLEGQVTALLLNEQPVDILNPGEEGIILLDKTPFYAEKGGQVADVGVIEGADGLFEVMDCQSPFPGIILHKGRVISGTFHVKSQIEASVNLARRQKIANNHTATHLLHWALQEILGEHVKQAGSIVDQERLRFDFSHHKPVSLEEIHAVEDLVNQKIRENQPVQIYEISYEEAQKRKDIKQFFGEKYGSKVRVIDIDYSKELCGGTHTNAVGNIGFFRIVQEGSISAGIRRIEAVTGQDAEKFSKQNEQKLLDLATLLKVQKDQVLERVAKLVEENKNLNRLIEENKKASLLKEVDHLVNKIENIKGFQFLATELDIDASSLKEIAELMLKKMPSLILCLATHSENKATLMIKISQDYIQLGFKAGEMIKLLAPIIEGSGGGKADFAQAGGKAPQKISLVLEEARKLVEKQCQSHPI